MFILFGGADKSPEPNVPYLIYTTSLTQVLHRYPHIRTPMDSYIRSRNSYMINISALPLYMGRT